MIGSLEWQSNTNTTENSCKEVQCDCSTFWEIYQQQAIMRLSNLQDQKTNTYKLEPGYEARARRIASVYAKIYLEQEISGNKQLKGRYYWMGLGAFASKTVAAVFKHGLTRNGYKWIPLGFVRDPVHSFAKGNLWLFMDIAPWHYGWSASSFSFNQCKVQRNVSNYRHIKKEVMNLPWSNCLPVISNLQCTNEIMIGFAKLPAIEQVFKQSLAEQKKFKTSAKDLFLHLLTIAVQEQSNILQEVVWKDWKVQGQAIIQRTTGTPESTLVLSSDYDSDVVRKNKLGQYTGRLANELSQLPESAYSEPIDGTKVENYDSRMKWIQKAAEKYHRLMQNEKGRKFLEKELMIIAGWGNSKAEFKVGSDSNDGKI
ncbi:DUF2515 family protein [Acinetobacter venetianus]|uniref:DUF2515 family protein n=1 Tax=Acinetobacter venetianus TaxID=52133 RepID=UPI0010A5DE1C|nr:hypothetical protein [Acinetobacter venetianus]MCR4530714.1 hypothetical protein [Acinetobacter venetianus]MDA0696687.1 hypothetical protein [Pseudomonadota bacterium]MDA1255005.1 hypothetical protein [Pseudomonadota bacterium]